MTAIGHLAARRLAAGGACALCGVAAAAAAGATTTHTLLPAALASAVTLTVSLWWRSGNRRADAHRLEQAGAEIDHIVIGAADMQGLVDVGHEVREEHQRTLAVGRRARGAGHHGLLALDLGHDAVQRAAIGLVAVIEADRVEAQPGIAQVGEQAYRTVRALAGGGLAALPAAAQDNVFKIGLVLPMTGQQATTGRQIEAAARLYMAQTGDTVGGKKVQLIVKDDTSLPDVTRRLAQELDTEILSPAEISKLTDGLVNVDGILGGLYDPLVKPVLPANRPLLVRETCPRAKPAQALARGLGQVRQVAGSARTGGYGGVAWIGATQSGSDWVECRGRG